MDSLTRNLNRIILDILSVLLWAITPVMALKGYWTNNSHAGPGMRAYHVFLDGIYPSSVGRHIRLLNQNLSACLDFRVPPNTDYAGNTNDPNPFLCHHIKESDIPKTNDSILDVGYFVVSDKLNEMAAEACINGDHNWYLCNSQTIDANSFYNYPKLLADLGPTYDDVWVNDACLTYHHLKEGTPEFHDCDKMIG
jgi:hypothetical protein